MKFSTSSRLFYFFQIPASPKVECVNCHTSVAMDMLKSHDEVCQGGSSTSGIGETLENW